MTIMQRREMNLNIRYDLPQEIWDKVEHVYASLDGWLGYGDGKTGEQGIPYWFSFNENEKHIFASVEPAGVQFCGLMEQEEWDAWVKKIKQVATQQLGFKVGEIERGEVGHDIEYLD